MPIKRCLLSNGEMGYQWGDHGKCYPSRAGAEAQARAAYASGYKKKAAEVQLTAPELVQKLNPYHDEVGRFTTKDKDVLGKGLLASNLYKKYDKDITERQFLATLPLEVRDRMSSDVSIVRQQLNAKQHSSFLHAKDKSKVKVRGISAKNNPFNYTEDRLAVHRELIEGVLSGGKWNPKTKSFDYPDGFDPKPKEGTSPTLMILGGRGGSGKGTFDKEVAKARGSANGVYDRKTTVVLDADEFKSMLASKDGYDGIGARAALYHDESDALFSKALSAVKKQRLNVVLDLTLKSNKSNLLDRFKSVGYRAELHYMHLPRDEAIKSAIDRYIAKGTYGGRLVLPQVILENKTNEHYFDIMKEKADSWSLWTRASKEVGPDGNPVRVR